MKIQTTIDQLNRLTFKAMSSSDITKPIEAKAVVELLEKLRQEGYSIVMGSSDYNYSIGELRVIEKLLAWITQIMYAEGSKIKEVELLGEEAEPELFDDQIADAINGLINYRELHPDGIPFFIIKGNEIVLKCSPYFIFEEIMMYKTGFIVPGKTELSDFIIS